MKKLLLNEEFSLEGNVYSFTQKDGGSIALKRIREVGASKSKPSFVPPTLEMVKEYFKSEGYTEDSAIKFHKGYSSNDWKDSNDKPVKAWKMKAINVWFKEPHKIIKQETQGIKFFM